MDKKKKRANIAIYINVQEARLNGLKFFSAPNEVIMCSGNGSGYIPIKYFKEIKNIQTAEQTEIMSASVIDKIKMDKRLNLLVQNYIPNGPTTVTSLIMTNGQSPQTQVMPVRQNKKNNTKTKMTPVIASYHDNKEPEVTPATQ